MQLVYKFGFHRQVLEIDEGDDNIRIKIFNSILQKVRGNTSLLIYKFSFILNIT